MKRVIRLVLSSLCAAAVMLGAAGCSGDPKVSTAEPATLPVIGPDSSLPTGTAAPSPSADPTVPDTTKATEAPVPSTEETSAPTISTAAEPTEPSTAQPTGPQPSVPDVPADG